MFTTTEVTYIEYFHGGISGTYTNVTVKNYPSPPEWKYRYDYKRKRPR